MPDSQEQEDPDKIFVIRWWGPRQPAMHGPDSQISTPVEERCAYCEQAILDGQQGWSLPRYDSNLALTLQPYHYDCLLHNLHLV